MWKRAKSGLKWPRFDRVTGEVPQESEMVVKVTCIFTYFTNVIREQPICISPKSLQLK